MSIKGTLDPMYIDGATSALMRDGGRYFSTGWWGVDDNHNPQIGPYGSREACRKACDAINEAES